MSMCHACEQLIQEQQRAEPHFALLQYAYERRSTDSGDDAVAAEYFRCGVCGSRLIRGGEDVGRRRIWRSEELRA
jgi:hypothetical protein